MIDTQSQNLVLPGGSPAFFIYFYRLFAKLNKLFAYFSKLFVYFFVYWSTPLEIIRLLTGAFATVFFNREEADIFCCLSKESHCSAVHLPRPRW